MTRCFRDSTCGTTMACALAMALVAPRGHAADCAPPSPTAKSYVANNCDGTIAGGTFDTGATGYASVFHAANNGSITVTGPVTLHSGGNESTGAYAESGGAIHFNAPGSTLTMLGAHSNGVHAFGNATVTGQVNISTSGERGHALFADFGGVVQMHDSTILTQGAEASGIAVATGSISLLGASAITTTGDIAPGVALTSSKSNVVVDGQGARIPIQTSGMESPGAASANGSGTIVLRGVDITTSGVAAFGVLAQSATTVQAENSTIVTTGPGSVGVEAIDGGNVTLVGGSVTTLMRGAQGLSARGAGSQIVADGTAVTVSGTATTAMQVIDHAHIALRNGSAISTGLGGSALSMYSTDDSMVQTAEITRSTLVANQGSALAFLGGPAAVAITGSSVAGTYLLSVDARTAPIAVDVTASGSALRGASLVMPAEGGGQHAVRLALRDNSAWLITGDSNLTRLESIGSAVAFVSPADGVFHSLTLGGYHSEGGTLGLTAALAGDGSPADKLVIDGGTVTGATALRIVNAGGKGALTSEGIRVIEAINGGSAPAGTFGLAGRAVAGPYEYRLYRGSTQNPADGNWYLRSQQLPTPPDPPAPPTPPDPPPTPPDPPAPPAPLRPMYRPEVPAYIANEYAAASLFLHSLHDRMGELPFSSAPGGWLRLVGKTAESGSRGNDYGARANTVVLQGGGDIARGSLFGATDRLHVGAMLGYGNVRTDGLAAGNTARAQGEVNGYGAGMYATWFGQAASDLGPYVDTWFQYTWFDSNVRGDQLPKVGYHSQAWNVSLEGGWALPLAASSWRVAPQAQVAWLRHRGVSVTEPGGAQIHGGDTNGVVTRLGVRIFRTLDRGDGGRLQPYATLNWWHDQASTSVGFSETVLGQLFPRDRYELKLGLDARLSRGWSSWGNIGGQWGSQGYRQYALRLGARYAW